MKTLKNKIIVVGMSLTTAIAFFASTAGTLAWYAYSTNVSLSFTGTSIRKSELIHVGLVDGTEVENTHKITDAEISQYQLNRETSNGKSIIWTTSSTGFPVEVIKIYLERNGYAYNFLSPITTKSRDKDGAIDDNEGHTLLYQSPGYGVTTVTNLAHKSQYVRLPFAFKSVGHDNENMKNKNVWLTDAEVTTSGGRRINESIRVHVDNGTSKFLINPNQSTNDTGSTKVGGLLDLDGDGTYDFDLLSTPLKEYVYGEIKTGTPTFDETYDVDYEHAELDDVNGVKEEGFPKDESSTFYAKHKKGVNIADLTGVAFKTADYYTFNGVSPDLDSNGDYNESTGKPITTTSNDKYGIGYATLTIYLEGWDHSVVNAAIGHNFNLGLTFEINKV